MSRDTPLLRAHEASGAKLVDFAGWRMPLHYGSQLREHECVRSACGVFDVSHMTIIDLVGTSALAFLRRVVANDAAKLDPGRALYGVLLTDDAGIIDDLIVYRIDDDYRIVVNAATRDGVLAALQPEADALGVELRERSDEAMIAVQGPQAMGLFAQVSGLADSDTLPLFGVRRSSLGLVARTGYTGEDGVEVMLPAAEAPAFWARLVAAGAEPCGLGARDTLRLEAGLNLYGQDMDLGNHPLESNLGWTISWQPEDRQFRGRERLEAVRRSYELKLTGVVLEARGVMRGGCTVDCGDAGSGVVTSGIFSPTLGYSIGLARVPRKAQGSCTVTVRGKALAARLVKPPFVRNGKQVFE